MRFISYITGGFYFSVDENLEVCTIIDRRLFYVYNICSSSSFSSTTCPSGGQQTNNAPDSNQLIVEEMSSSQKQKQFQMQHQHHHHHNLGGGGGGGGGTGHSCDENDTEEQRDYFNREINLIKYSDKISLSNRTKIMRKLAAASAAAAPASAGTQRDPTGQGGGGGHHQQQYQHQQQQQHADIWSLLAGDAPLNEQMFEFKCIQRYELTQRASSVNLLQLVRIRAYEGFYLARISHELVRPNKSAR